MCLLILGQQSSFPVSFLPCKYKYCWIGFTFLFTYCLPAALRWVASCQVFSFVMGEAICSHSKKTTPYFIPRNNVMIYAHVIGIRAWEKLIVIDGQNYKIETDRAIAAAKRKFKEHSQNILSIFCSYKQDSKCVNGNFILASE